MKDINESIYLTLKTSKAFANYYPLVISLCCFGVDDVVVYR